MAEQSREGRLFSKAKALPRNPGERPKNKQSSLELHQGIMELFEAGGSDAVLFIQEGKSRWRWDCRGSSISSTELKRDRHKKRADLGWGEQQLMLSALAFSTHSKKTPQTQGKTAQVWMEGQNLH